MRRRAFLRTVGVTAVAGTAGCNTKPVVTKPNTPTGATPTPDHEIRMEAAEGTYFFDPLGQYLRPGETVRWVNEGGIHTVTAYTPRKTLSVRTRRIPSAADAWHSGQLKDQGESFQHTFEVSGTYDYICNYHYDRTYAMIGRIVVDRPGGPAEDSPPKLGRLPEADRIVEDGRVGYREFHSDSGTATGGEG